MNWYWKTWGWAIVLAPVVLVLIVAAHMGLWPASFLVAGLFIAVRIVRRNRRVRGSDSRSIKK